MSGKKSKKKGLDISVLLGPWAHAPTEIGEIYLFPLRVSDLIDYEKIEESEPAIRVRKFLPFIASLSADNSLANGRFSLSPAEVEQISDQSLEVLAAAYSSAAVKSDISEDEARGETLRENNESSVQFMDRLIRMQIELQAEQSRKIRGQLTGVTSSLFDQVRRSSMGLGSTLSAFEKLTKSDPMTEVRSANLDHVRSMNEQFARQSKERAEELEMVRLTSRMTAQSAQTLKDLADAATILLEQLDARDKKSDSSTRAQINIAVWSVGISAVIALLALVISGFAYFQDKANIEGGDKWQSELIAAVRGGNQQLTVVDKELERLQHQISVLEAKIASIESAGVGVETKDHALQEPLHSFSDNSSADPGGRLPSHR